MKATVFLCAAAAVCTAAPSQATTRDERNKALHINLVVATGVCSEMFGFTPVLSYSPTERMADVQKRTEKDMIEKIDAYWLLRGSYEVTDYDPAWSAWYSQIAKPIVAMLEKDEAQPGERDAAAAAVAASKDPSLYDEAKAQYLASAMRPTNAAVEACRAGAADPFIGKHYWTGQSSEAKVKEFEKEMSDYFAELVGGLRDK